MASTRSVQLYSTWKAAGHPVELHIYAKGGHGFGMKKQGLPSDSWIERLGDWLQAQGLLSVYPSAGTTQATGAMSPLSPLSVIGSHLIPSPSDPS